MNNDLISREALKKAIEEVEYNYDGYDPCDLGRFMNKVDELIDNAPTVELTEEQAIDKLHETGWMPLHDKEMTERPTGEWKDLSDGWQEGTYECSYCKTEFVLTEGTPEDNEYHYCPYCGAKMKGGSDDTAQIE